MWVNKSLFQMIVDDNKAQQGEINRLRGELGTTLAGVYNTRDQKAKDDITIDWMRHRINALEKQNSILVMKTSGVLFPVPEIVPTRPGTMSELPDFPTMPSFEDVGNTEAARLGIVHTPDGQIDYTK